MFYHFLVSNTRSKKIDRSNYLKELAVRRNKIADIKLIVTYLRKFDDLQVGLLPYKLL